MGGGIKELATDFSPAELEKKFNRRLRRYTQIKTNFELKTEFFLEVALRRQNSVSGHRLLNLIL